MTDVVRQVASAVVALFLFSLVIAGAATASLSQIAPPTQGLYTPMTASSTLRIIVVQTETETKPAIPTVNVGTKTATSASMIITPSNTSTPTFTPTLTPTRVTVQCQTPMGWRLYTVQPGDNLYRIGLLFRVSSYQLQKANCMGNSTTILSGQSLWVPNVPTSTPVFTATLKSHPTSLMESKTPSASLTSTPTMTQTLTTTISVTVTMTETPTTTATAP